MTVQELHAQTKDAERRLVDAVKGYKSLAGKCYVLQSDGSFLPLARYILGEGKCSKLLDTGRFMELRRAQQGNVTLYRRKRDGRYIPTGDFQACLDYEAEIARAMEDAWRYRWELERITA